MKEVDWETAVKAVRAPERGEAYWQAFPERVLAELRARPHPVSDRADCLAALGWAGKLALACLVTALGLSQTGMPRAVSRAVVRNEIEFRHLTERVQANLGRLMRDEHGLHKLVEDQS